MPEVYSADAGGAITASLPPRQLLDQVRDAWRVKHYSYRTEQAYVGQNHWSAIGVRNLIGSRRTL